MCCAAALVRPYNVGLARLPELTSIYMTSGLDVPLESRDWGWLGSEQDAAHLGGELGGAPACFCLTDCFEHTLLAHRDVPPASGCAPKAAVLRAGV